MINSIIFLFFPQLKKNTHTMFVRVCILDVSPCVSAPLVYRLAVSENHKENITVEKFPSIPPTLNFFKTLGKLHPNKPAYPI